MKYANIKLESPFVMGPMAAYTDVAFRLLCRKNGAAMCFTQFSNANAIIRNVKTSWELMQTVRQELPVGIQIFGSDAKIISQATKLICGKIEQKELFASCIDLNFGCPSGSVIRAGAGSALLKKPEKICEIVEQTVAASSIPVTAKIRAGWSSDNTLSLAKLIEKSGASGITVHWRTATEGRKRAVGWHGLRDVKESLSIPVIANGGARTPELAVKMLNETGCDGVMIASGALGRPEIFRQANDLLSGKEFSPMLWKEKLALFLEYVSLAEKHGILSPKRLRIQAIEFVSYQPGVKYARAKLNSAKSVDEIISIMRDFEPLGI